MIDAYIVDNDCIYGNILDHHLTLKIIMAYKYMKHLHPRTSTMKPSPSKKLKRLEKSKTLNPSPEKIKHPLFRLRSDFFDPNDLLQVRYEMVRLVLLEHQTLAQAARHFGVSRPTCFRMTRAFKNAGLEGLKPAPRGPRGPAQDHPGDRQLRRQLPRPARTRRSPTTGTDHREKVQCPGPPART